MELIDGPNAGRCQRGVPDDAPPPLYTIALSQSAEGRARQILVNVDAFVMWQTGRSVLIAEWSILDANRRALLSTARGTFTTAAGVNPGDGAIVTAMADAVRQLAERIASSAEALTPRAAPELIPKYRPVPSCNRLVSEHQLRVAIPGIVEIDGNRGGTA